MEKKKIVILEDIIERAQICADVLSGDQIEIEKIFIFKEKDLYAKEMEAYKTFIERYENKVEQVDIWNYDIKLDELYIKEEDTVFLMDWGLEGDGSDEQFARSAAVIYTKKKIDEAENQEKEAVKDRFFLYTTNKQDISDQLRANFPEHCIPCDLQKTPFLLYRENEQFCKIFKLKKENQ